MCLNWRIICRKLSCDYRILILIYLGLTTRTTETVTDKDIPLFGAKFCSVNRKRKTFALSRTRKLKFLCMTCYSNLGVGDHNSKLPNAMVKSLPPRRDFSLAARPCLSINSRQRDISRERWNYDWTRDARWSTRSFNPKRVCHHGVTAKALPGFHLATYDSGLVPFYSTWVRHFDLNQV